MPRVGLDSLPQVRLDSGEPQSGARVSPQAGHPDASRPRASVVGSGRTARPGSSRGTPLRERGSRAVRVWSATEAGDPSGLRDEGVDPLGLQLLGEQDQIASHPDGQVLRRQVCQETLLGVADRGDGFDRVRSGLEHGLIDIACSHDARDEAGRAGEHAGTERRRCHRVDHVAGMDPIAARCALEVRTVVQPIVWPYSPSAPADNADPVGETCGTVVHDGTVRTARAKDPHQPTSV